MMRVLSFTAAVLLAATAAHAETWKIDPAHSRAQFTVRHLMVSNVRGDFGAVTGTIDYDGKDLAKATVRATVDTTTVTTRVAPRDEHIKSADFLDVANHPTMTFISTAITPTGGGRYNMTGTLTIRGVTRPVTFVMEAPAGPITNKGATRIGAAATATINRKEFGVKYHDVMDNGGLGVADEVLIQVDLEAVLPKPPAATN